MNLLILSVGTRNKLVRYFRKTFEGTGRIVATDASPLAPALYEADQHYIVPSILDTGYLEYIFQICRKEHIDGVLSLIDPELSLLAENAEAFRAVGIMTLCSSSQLCELSLDKMEMFRWLTDHRYLCAKSWNEPEGFYKSLDEGEVFWPVFVKPVRGSASLRISKAVDRDMLDMLFSGEENLMIQEYMDGAEIGVDAYVDMISGETVSVFTKKKLKMRAGETDKSVSFKDPLLFTLIECFLKETGFRGPVDIDIFDINGRYYISEVNPRFGGGYPHAHEAGCDHTKLILNNLLGLANPPRIGEYEENIYMMKYNEVLIKRGLD